MSAKSPEKVIPPAPPPDPPPPDPPRPAPTPPPRPSEPGQRSRTPRPGAPDLEVEILRDPMRPVRRGTIHALVDFPLIDFPTLRRG